MNTVFFQRGPKKPRIHLAPERFGPEMTFACLAELALGTNEAAIPHAK
jgi:hypothetical protein